MIGKPTVYSIAVTLFAVATSTCNGVFAFDAGSAESTQRVCSTPSKARLIAAGKPAPQKKKNDGWNSDLSKMMDGIGTEVVPKEPSAPASKPGTATPPGTSSAAPPEAGTTPPGTTPKTESAEDLLNENAPGDLPPEPGSDTASGSTSASTGQVPTTIEPATTGASAPPTGPAADLPVTAIPESTSSQNDYFAQIKQVGLARWPSSRLPIKVYIESNSKVPGFRPEFITILRIAFRDWEKAAGGKINTEFVDTASSANLVCLWTDNPSEMMSTKEGGNAIVVPDGQGIVRVDMKLLTQPPLGSKTMPSNFMRRVCLHEVGHAFGLTGHSTESGDIMFDTVFLNEKPADLTPRDKNTIIALYLAPEATIAANRLDPLRAVIGSAGALNTQNLAMATPGPMGSTPSQSSFPNAPAGIPRQSPTANPKMTALHLSNEAAVALSQQNFPVALSKLEEAHKLDPSNPLIKTNLGVIYANFGSIAGMTFNMPVAAQYYKKAIPLLEGGNNPTALKQVLGNYIQVLKTTRDQVELKKMEAKLQAQK